MLAPAAGGAPAAVGNVPAGGTAVLFETVAPADPVGSGDPGRSGGSDRSSDADRSRDRERSGDPDRPDRPRGPGAPDGSDDLDLLGDRIAGLAAHLHAVTFEMLELIREFDRREGWRHGFRSCAHWLSWRTGFGPGAAREKVRVARALGELPLISGAMARGELSFSKVRALTRVANPENEPDLLELARHASAAQTERLVRAWRRVDRLDGAGAAEAERRRHESRHLHLRPDEDGSWVIRGRLDPEVGALLEKALERAGEALHRKASPEEAAETSAGQRRADAIGLVAEQALKADGTGSGSRADRFQVVLHVEEDGSSVLDGSGTGVTAETSRRLSCDAGRVTMTHAPDGRILSVGRRSRTVPTALRRALEHRDRGCRFPACGARLTDAHHVRHWAEGGETRLDNLVLLCRFHHRAVHEGGCRVRLLPGGEVRFHRPDGRVIPEVPALPEVPEVAPLTGVPGVAPAPRSPAPTGAAGPPSGSGTGTPGPLPDPWTTAPLSPHRRLDLGLALEMLRGRGRPAERKRENGDSRGGRIETPRGNGSVTHR